jgi:hypothetical protein
MADLGEGVVGIADGSPLIEARMRCRISLSPQRTFFEA